MIEFRFYQSSDHCPSLFLRKGYILVTSWWWLVPLELPACHAFCCVSFLHFSPGRLRHISEMFFFRLRIGFYYYLTFSHTGQPCSLAFISSNPFSNITVSERLSQVLVLKILSPGQNFPFGIVHFISSCPSLNMVFKFNSFNFIRMLYLFVYEYIYAHKYMNVTTINGKMS